MKLDGLRSPMAQLAGLVHFPRMIDKIRLKEAGTLPDDYVLGEGDGTCLDGRLTRFFKVDYETLADQVRQGASDEDIARWLEENATDFTPERILILNQFLSKRGFRDESSPGLQRRKTEAGFADREDIQTWFDLMMAEEE